MNIPASYATYSGFERAAARLVDAFGIELGQPPRELFRRFGDYEVHIDEHLPAATPVGTVILVHGAGVHGRMLWPFAAPLVTGGWRVLAPDLPGYGLTRGPIARVAYGDWVALVAELAEQEAKRSPVVLFGLSAGGLTALLAAHEARSVAGVIVTTLLDLSDTHTFDSVARTRVVGRIARVFFRHFPRLVDRIMLPLRWLAPLQLLTSDAGLRRALRDDPLIGQRPVSLRLFRTMHQHSAELAMRPLRCPLLLAHPGADRWTPPALSMPLFNALPGDKQWVMLTNGEHAPLEAPAYGELVAAITRFLAPLAAGRPVQRCLP